MYVFITADLQKLQGGCRVRYGGAASTKLLARWLAASRGGPVWQCSAVHADWADLQAGRGFLMHFHFITTDYP